MLKKLELTGFKSFANKTTLDFSPGITAVVGPNGSGKSNIIDAIRWLLGERDAKHLRGEKVGDLIFAGTPKKPRVGLAQASIYLDNSSQIFPVEYLEVVVTREVDRGGNSRYFLNQAEVRLRDLVDFFARARLGVRGLVVIGQGESDMFLRANPLERREMIEEILGLREFQLKKSEAERKLKNTSINLEKAETLIREISPHLKALKRQTSRWERRSEVEEDLKNLESIFYGSRFSEIQAELVSLKPEGKKIADQIAGEFKLLEELQKNVDKTEGTGSGHHRELKELQETRTGHDSQKSKLEKEIGRLEAQIEFLRERDFESQDEIDIGLAVPFLKRLKNQLDELLSADFETVRREVIKLTEEIKSIFRVKKRTGMTLAEAEGYHKKYVAELAIVSSSLDTLKNKEREVSGLIESKSGEFKEAIFRYQAKKDAIKELENYQNKLLFEEERARLKIQDLEEQVQTARVNWSQITSLPIAIPVDFSRIGYEKNIMRLRGELASMGEVDEALIKEANDTAERYSFLTTQAEDLKKASVDLVNLKNELESKISSEFETALKKINLEFTKYFGLMFGGGKATLGLSVPNTKNKEQKEKNLKEDGVEIMSGSISDVKDEEQEPEQPGINIEISIPRKRITGLEMLSGGERTLVSIAVLFALAAVSPPPFLVLDEMDAALDERNARRFAEMLRELAKKTQFVLVSHNRATMESAHILYGITMGEDGTSKVLSLKLDA